MSATPVAPLTLRSSYERRPGADVESAPGWFGTFELVLDIDDPAAFPPGSQLAVWCTMLLEPTAESNARVVDRLSGHLVLEPRDPPPLDGRPVPGPTRQDQDEAARAAGRLVPGPTRQDPTRPDERESAQWTIGGVRSAFPARHANDGPERAYAILPTGETIDVKVIPSTRIETRASTPATADPSPPPAVPTTPSGPPLVPYPTLVESAGAGTRRRLELEAASPSDRAAWTTIRELAHRLGDGAFDRQDAEPLPVTIVTDDSVAGGGYRIEFDATGARLAAADPAGTRSGLTTLAQWSAAAPSTATVHDRPAMPVRIVHLDLARRWYEPDVVGRLIDVAAWRKFNRVHLHLTDDEAWRVPVTGYPELTSIGATRGHGLPIGPFCGSGPAPYGRAYTAAEIADWVDRADRLGVTLVPEVDVPGHCHAALVALPRLRDPDDTSTAASVQGFPRNALVPGHPETMPFLAAVFGSLAELFPTSPWLHIGGDEVAHGAWDGSPMVAAYAAARGVATQRDIETSFHRELIEMIRSTTGRDVAMWEEAALAGLEPSGYTVAWTSADAGHRLAAAGHDVVMAQGQAYYLDMAAGPEWERAGSAWAGNVPFETTCEFDPRRDWPTSAPGRLLGVQACIWGEHISDLAVLDALTFPRLDAVAERGWTGEIVGGPDQLRARAAHLPRFSPTL